MKALKALYLQIGTKRFETYQTEAAIGRWYLGADLAGWIYSKMLPKPSIYYLQGPVMEDWGWQCGFRVGDGNILLSIGSPEHESAKWTLFIEARKSKTLFQRRSRPNPEDALEVFKHEMTAVLAESEEIGSFGWHEKNPLL